MKRDLREMFPELPVVLPPLLPLPTPPRAIIVESVVPALCVVARELRMERMAVNGKMYTRENFAAR